MSRPIDRLPTKKATSEPKEAMNCKSCRKRKIKCNRIRPRCEACQVFNCSCIYDAVPQKRGPKTDVLEALLKRVNGLEKRLKDEHKSSSPGESSTSSKEEQIAAAEHELEEISNQLPPIAVLGQPPDTIKRVRSNPVPIEPAPTARDESPTITAALLDTFFTRVHNKPYYVLDERATRQRLRDDRLPRFLIDAIRAVTIKNNPSPHGSHSGELRSSEEYAVRSRTGIDADEPSIDHLQALLLLAMASFQIGKGKKSYMLVTHAVSMAVSLNLHRELPTELRIAHAEREGRRKLFWTCYLMDRLNVSGSKRPSLILDESIHLRLPGWPTPGSQVWNEGDFFPNGSNFPHSSGVPSAARGGLTTLVEIVRVLGNTNRYLGTGGVKGDSYFPWHAQSTLSRLKSNLDCWAAANQELFTSIDKLFTSHDSSALVLSKLVYHLIHCLIYRPFLPIDLPDLSGIGEHRSWQIEATHSCFSHASAIAELIDIGNKRAFSDWPSFVGYCICTAGTVHVHGAHYTRHQASDTVNQSAECLAREMAQLHTLRSTWTTLQHQRDVLQTVYTGHAQLAKSLASNPMRFSPIFQMEDFFDRYPGHYIDGAYITFSDVVMDPAYDEFMMSNTPALADFGPVQFAPETAGYFPDLLSSQPLTGNHIPAVARRPKKRHSRASSPPYPNPKGEAPVRKSIEKQPHLKTPTMEWQANDDMQPPNWEDEQNPMLFQGTFMSEFAFNPFQSALALDPGVEYSNRDQSQPGVCYDQGMGANIDDGQAEPESDPFLRLLEQMAENGAQGFENGLQDFVMPVIDQN